MKQAGIKKTFTGIATYSGLCLVAICSLTLALQSPESAYANTTQTTGAQQSMVISLGVGAKKLIKLPSAAERVSLGNPSVAKVSRVPADNPYGPALVVEGLMDGNTTLLVWDEGSTKARAMTLAVGEQREVVDRPSEPVPTPELTPEPPADTPVQPVAEQTASTTQTVAERFAPPNSIPTADDAEKPFILPLSIGFQKVINLPAVPARVAIGDPSIASVTVLKPTGKGGKGAGVMVTGLKTGSTSLFIWDRGATNARVMTISVVSKSASTISSLGELKLDNDGQVQRLTGKIRDVGTYQQAREGLLKGTEGKTADVIDSATMAVPGTVQLDVKVVEFTRTELQSLGIDLSKQPVPAGTANSFSFDVMGGSATGNAFSLALQNISDDFDLALRILQSNGYARVLAEPSLVAQSGTEASFLAGGEVPIIVPSGNGSFSIQYKQFGVGLVFTPTILSDKNIGLKVSPEVSDLDFTRGVNLNGFTVPAIVTRRASTTVELGEKQTFVIGGLISRRVTANAGKVPWLADVPIIGAFFKRNDFSREDKELLITVTPHFVKPRNADAPALKMPGENIGINPRGIWDQIFFEDPKEPVPGFKQ